MSLLTPPVVSPPIDFEQPDQLMTPGNRSFHLVLLDNGRMALRDDPQLKEPIKAGRDVVVIEPTDLAMFWRRYHKLLPDAAAKRMRDGTYEIVDYVRRLLDDGADPHRLSSGEEQSVAYHSHYQQRTLDRETPTVAVLEALGYDVQTSSVECCGMAGSFGYKTEYYELSMRVGAELRTQIAGEMNGRVVAASGTSCQEQLHALLDAPVRHLIELIASGE